MESMQWSRMLFVAVALCLGCGHSQSKPSAILTPEPVNSLPDLGAFSSHVTVGGQTQSDQKYMWYTVDMNYPLAVDELGPILTQRGWSADAPVKKLTRWSATFQNPAKGRYILEQPATQGSGTCSLGYSKS